MKKRNSPTDVKQKIKELIQQTLQEALEAELEEFLGYSKYKRSDNDNYRNGYLTKTVKTDVGEVEIKTPRDRKGDFEPKAVNVVIGINKDGYKELLGFWISETESASYWLKILNDLKSRGVEDVLIFSVDGLAGINKAINNVYPNSDIQKCIVHQVRNSLRYIPWKERK